MAAARDTLSIDLEEELASTVRDLRHSMFRAFAWATALAHVGWYYYAVLRDYYFYFHTVSILLIVAIFILIARLDRKRYGLASSVLLAMIVLLEVFVFVRYRTPTALSLGVLGIVAANALQGTRSALLVALLTWLAGLALTWGGTGDSLVMRSSAGTLVVYLMAWAASWLSYRPMRASVEWAITGWAQARQALQEIRSRRSELYRALKALQEATSRIERMNHELIVARREAEVARAQKARFAATVSHELRGPLSLILGFSRLIARSPERYAEPLPMAYAQDIETIYRNTQHLVALVDDVLDLSQIDAEKLPLVKDRVDLNQDVVQKAISIVQPLIERKSLYLRSEVEEGIPSLIADAVRLRQALLNLLMNAIRFTTQGGIVVRTALRGDSVLVSVQDTGPGIAAQDIPRLFREFSQLERAEKGEARSSGLGLNISKELIELHGGSIWVESDMGAGTTVHFAVPLPGASEKASTLINTEAAAHPSNGEDCCLVVHNDPSVVRLLARYIQGCRVVGLPREQNPVEWVSHLHPKAILTTPDMVEPLETALAAARLPVPLIACGMPLAEEQPQFQGVMSYLIKPILPEAVASVMGQVEQNGETNVLIVDDEPDATRLLENMLTALPRPYHIARAYSGREALKRMESIVPDIVFLDLVMPDLNGEQVVAQMRDDERLAEVPVVIISARDWAGDKLAVETPITVRTPKPLDLGQAAKCFGAILEALSADYLPEAAPRGSL